METCPNCGFARDENDSECPKCGIIYEKYQLVSERKEAEKSETKTVDEESRVDDKRTSANGWKFKDNLNVIQILCFVYFLSCTILLICLIAISSYFAIIPALLLLTGITFYSIRNAKRDREQHLQEMRKRKDEEKRREDEQRLRKLVECGFKEKSKEYKVFNHLFSYLERESIWTKEFHSCKIYDLGYRRAVELRSGDPDCGAIDSIEFRQNVVREMKQIKDHLSEIDFKELNQVGENSFPAVFLFTHQCKFLTAYGEEVSGFDAMVSSLFEDIMKIQPAFNKDLLHKIARVEFCNSGIEIENFTYEELIIPGIVKGGGKRSQITPALREQLLKDADYACENCGARASDGATLEIDHIVPVSKGGSDEYSNLQVLCATCNRKKGSRN